MPQNANHEIARFSMPYLLLKVSFPKNETRTYLEYVWDIIAVFKQCILRSIGWQIKNEGLALISDSMTYGSSNE